MGERPKLRKIGADMSRWCAVIAEELSTWPDVSSRPMFGMTAFYRGTQIFTALPKTRAPDTDRSLLIKLPGVRHPRLKGSKGPGAGWVTFELLDETQITEALDWLGKAYEKARN